KTWTFGAPRRGHAKRSSRNSPSTARRRPGTWSLHGRDRLVGGGLNDGRDDDAAGHYRGGVREVEVQHPGQDRERVGTARTRWPLASRSIQLRGPDQPLLLRQDQGRDLLGAGLGHAR